MKFLRSSLVVAAILVCQGCGRSDGPPAKDYLKTGVPRGNPNLGPARGSQQSEASDPEELDRLKGYWQAVAIEWAGNKLPDDRVQEINLRYVLQGGILTFVDHHGSIAKVPFAIDTSASPKKMTINLGNFREYASGKPITENLRNRTASGPPIKAIYNLEGNKLQICLMLDKNQDAEYPKELVSQASPETDLITLERR